MSDLMSYEAKLEAGCPVVLYKGEIDLSNSDEVMRAALKTFADLTGPVLLDLSQVTYIDSSGINVFFNLSRRLQVSGRDLRLVIPHHSRLHRLVDLTRLDSVSKISSTLGEAVKEARNSV